MSRRGRIPRRVLWVAAFFVVLIVGAMAGVRQYYYRNLRPVSDAQQVSYVTIDSGTTASQIASKLQDQGLIRNHVVFEWYVNSKELRTRLQAGTYALRPSMSVPDIAVLITEGKIATDTITILPAQPLDQIRKTFLKAGFSSDAVDQALDPVHYSTSAALADKPAGANLEGFLYPDTFQKNDTTAPADIVKQSLTEMSKQLTPEIRAAFAQQGLSVYQGITLASMVEQEVGQASDRAQAAQVFLKRLHSNMMLGSDVTAFYGARLNNQKPSTTYDSPYNTLLHPGLPPGPISNVSDSSLQAVAHPANTDWLFFVAGDDGTTHFSKTLAEHQALTAQYCHKLCTATR